MNSFVHNDNYKEDRVECKKGAVTSRGHVVDLTSTMNHMSASLLECVFGVESE